MNKLDGAIFLILVMLVAGWIDWVGVRKEKLRPTIGRVETEKSRTVPDPDPQSVVPEHVAPVVVSSIEGSFPAPTVQMVNGRPERTIHMGVRQYAWDPPLVMAKKGELVRLIIHNADVQHGLVIPELNVLNIDIPTEGAVIEFEASKVGTFVFFCSYYCGEGHSEMRGKLSLSSRVQMS